MGLAIEKSHKGSSGAVEENEATGFRKVKRVETLCGSSGIVCSVRIYSKRYGIDTRLGPESRCRLDQLSRPWVRGRSSGKGSPKANLEYVSDEGLSSCDVV